MKRIILATALVLAACTSTPTQTPVEQYVAEQSRPPLPSITIRPPSIPGYTADQGVQVVDTLSKCMVVYDTYMVMTQESGDVENFREARYRLQLFQEATAQLYGYSAGTEKGLGIATDLMIAQRNGIIQTYEHYGTPMEERQRNFKAIVEQCEPLFIRILKRFNDIQQREAEQNPFADQTFL